MEKKLYDTILNDTFKYFIATGNDIILESPIDDNYKVNFDQDRTSDNISDDIFDYIGDDTISIKHINISPSFFINPNYILKLKDDKSFYENMSYQAYKKVYDNYSFDHQRKKFIDDQAKEWQLMKSKVDELNTVREEMLEIKSLLRELLNKKEL